MKSKTILLSLILSILWVYPNFADTIKLKSGKVISGNIIEETDTYIRLDTIDGEDAQVKELLLKYIESIEYEDAVDAPMTPPVIKEKVLPPTLQTVPEQQIQQEIPSSPAIEMKLPATLDNEAIRQLLGETADPEPQQPTPEELEQQMQDFAHSSGFRKFALMAFGFMGGFFLIVISVGAAIGYFVSKKLDQGALEGFPKSAGFWRRLSARVIDFYVSLSILMFFCLIVPGLIIPLDRHFGIIILLLILMIVISSWYIFLGIAYLTNTYGRYVMNIQVKSFETNERPTLGQAFKRELLSGLWLIEAFVIVFNQTKRRMGDCWAGTYVAIIKSSHHWIRRVIPGILIITVFFLATAYIAPLVNNRMDITQAAKKTLQQQYGEEMVDLPSRVEIVNHEGMVTFKLKNNENVAVYLIRTDQGWIVQQIEQIRDQQLGKGFSIHLGS